MTSRARRRLVGVAALGLLALPAVPTPAGAAPSALAPGGFDGNPATTERVNEGHPVFAAVDISKIRFADGVAAHVALARANSFADAVAGSGLSGDGPLLFTTTKTLSKPTAAEIDRVLDPGDTVYLLGGTAAISDAVATSIRDRGYVVKRLAGTSRVGTAIKVADEVRRLHPGDDVLLARSSDWADSVTGGGVAAAQNTPVLVTPTDALHPAVAAWLAKDAPSTTTLLGGTAALSKAVEDAVPHPRRVSGTDRTATAAAVATTLWGARTRFVVTNGMASNGWSFGFAAAGLAADADAPILLVTDEVTEPTADLVRTCGAPAVDIEVVGDGTVVPASLREQLDAADGFACGPAGALVYPTDLTAFPACVDVLAAFKQSALERVGPYGLGGWGDYGGGGGPRILETTTPTTSPGAPDAGTGGDTASNSTTNNQEEGVDEPDIVKTTSTHAYVVAQNELHVVRLGSGSPVVVATLALPNDGMSELLLNGNRLLVVTRRFSFAVEGGPPVGVASDLVARGATNTTLTYVDVTDPANPRVDSTLDVDGDYRSARMIGSVARLVIQSDPSALQFEFPTDATPDAEQVAAEHNRTVIENTTLDDWLPSYTVNGGNETALLSCGDVRRPPLFSGLGTLSVVTVDLAGGIQPTSTAAVVASGENVYASTSRLFVTTGRWDWSADALGSTVTTEVHGFDISSPSATSYVGSGSVPGYVINQYALSELGGNLRIATTLEPPWTPEGTQVGETESAIHVLAERNGGYEEIGSVGGLGLGERIFAVRYFGDIAAVVTFRQVDPLYLVDLSDPAAPRVTGQLKINGFSSYLHRVDDGRLLGVGSEANDAGMVTGAQVSLFDISNVAAPSLVDKLTFPNGYTQVQYDPHAFLYWPATGLAVVPIDEYTINGPGFSGAVGISVTSGGLTEAGRASHTDDAGANSYPTITRSFVADGVLYTVSDTGLESENVSNLQERAFVAF